MNLENIKNGETTDRVFPTFLQLHRKELQLLHPLLQLVLRRRGNGIHLFVPPVIILVGVGVEHLEGDTRHVNPRGPTPFGTSSQSFLIQQTVDKRLGS